MSPEIVDADAHVVEAGPLLGECMSRWPDSFGLRAGEQGPTLLVEGRSYPEPTGPGAGCPPQHGLSRAEGINPYSPAGVLADAGAAPATGDVAGPATNLTAHRMLIAGRTFALLKVQPLLQQQHAPVIAADELQGGEDTRRPGTDDDDIVAAL